MSQNTILLSILIPTLQQRQQGFQRLESALQSQISDQADPGTVELLTLLDSGEASIGEKRNHLLDRANGKFVVFIDDDDEITNDYVERIMQAIRDNPETDCICFAAEIRFRGKHSQRMVHSVAYQDWYHSKGQYLRPPSHITPIRRNIAVAYRFPEINYAEDREWTQHICRDQALKSEVMLTDVLYIYHCRRWYGWQWVLNLTQPIRHALGLRHAHQ